MQRHAGQFSPVRKQYKMYFTGRLPIERTAHGEALSVRRRVREREAKPLLDALKMWLEGEWRPAAECLETGGALHYVSFFVIEAGS